MITLNEILYAGEVFRRILEEFPFLPPYHTWKYEEGILHQEIAEVPIRIRIATSTNREGEISVRWSTYVGDQVCVRTPPNADWKICWRGDNLRGALAALQEDLWHFLRTRHQATGETLEKLHKAVFSDP